ncbi:hypothetical protein ACO0RG_000430 [Hanseniaspora osmophila]|uniref:Fe repressor of activation 2 n=1 Tax=Hanseniaspora osmophila TaxID=56408 RepID=A0A1E5R2H2_9ASCO|nr:Fe repressor of activation 2 [Hanseniaspora osmophila]
MSTPQLTPESIIAKLQKEVPEYHNSIVNDISNGCGQNFEIVVISDCFKGKNKLMRCRTINKILKDEIAAIHAFSCKCFTTEEWAKIVI